ncbi:MAG: glycine zipper domain-containing protein [Desulfovibrio sp.]|nr:glycine zipper domain-containing protein [Desulfovibrio sp.]
MQRRAYLPLVFLLVGSLLFTGCTSRYGEQKTKVNYYPQCYEPVAQLRQDENSTGKSTAAGAAGGALLGALIGGLATGKVEGALAGAVAGGAAGAVGGNIYGKSQERQRDAAYLAKYNQQMGAEAASMNRATAAAKLATKCYDQQFKLAVGQYKANQISRLELQDRYNEIRSGLEETAFILKDTSVAMAQKDNEYQQVLAGQVKDTPSASTPAKSKKKSTPAVKQASLTPQASEWKSSRNELESTRTDVDARMNSYEQTVNNLLG